jgi:hypothetical protein
MNNKILEKAANLLEKYCSSFPKPDDYIGQPEHTTITTLWLAKEHGLRTIHWISRLLQEDKSNAVLACILLRSYYELSVRLLWASREPDGWLRLFTYYAQEKKKWASIAINSTNPDIVKLANDELQGVQKIEKWSDSHGNRIKSTPDIRQILADIERHETQNNPSSASNSWGEGYYIGLYLILCRSSHAHIEAIAGEVNRMYLFQAYVGALTSTTNLLQAFIYYTSKSSHDDISSMLKAFGPLLQRCSRV